MPLERIFLFLAIGGFCLYIIFIATAMVSLWPFGIVGLIVLALVIYVAVRLVREHTGNDEDKYYEDNFDK